LFKHNFFSLKSQFATSKGKAIVIANTDIAKAMEIISGRCLNELPARPEFVPGIRRAPRGISTCPQKTPSSP